eukprot:COSAG06_NODE_1869_length_8172_cov_3.579143_11_plen_90_part_00
MGQLHPLHQEVRLLNFKTQRAFVLSKQIEFPKTSSGQPSNVFVLSLFYISNISNRVVPVAESCGVFIGIHPDDPPFYPLGGVPRCVRPP